MAWLVAVVRRLAAMFKLELSFSAKILLRYGITQGRLQLRDVGNREFRKLITTKLIEFELNLQNLNQWYKPENDSPTPEVSLLPQLVVGGLIGYVHWGWLEIDIVWVDELQR